MCKRTLSTLNTLTKNRANPLISKTTRGSICVQRKILADHIILRGVNSVNKTLTVREGMHELIISREDVIEKTTQNGIIEDNGNIAAKTSCRVEASWILGHRLLAAIALTTDDALFLAIRAIDRAVTVKSSAWAKDQRNATTGTRGGISNRIKIRFNGSGTICL